MTKREADRVRRKIESAGGYRVMGYRHWERGRWELNVTDIALGYSFVVSSLEDWRERVGPRNTDIKEGEDHETT